MAIDRFSLLEALPALRHDLAAWDAKLADFTVVDAGNRSVVFGGPVNRELRRSLKGFPSSGLIVATAGSAWHVDDGADPMAAFVIVAAHLQDEMIDSLGRGWPELAVGGRFTSILTPQLVGGRPVWSDAKGTTVEFGDLAALRGDRIL